MLKSFTNLIQQLNSAGMDDTSLILILLSSFGNYISTHQRKQLVSQILWKNISNNHIKSSLKKKLESAHEDLKEFYDIEGFKFLSEFTYSKALDRFQKSNNWPLATKCLYEHESPNLLCKPFE